MAEKQSNFVLVNIKKDTYSELIRVRGKLMAETGKTVHMSEAIDFLLKKFSENPAEEVKNG